MTDSPVANTVSEYFELAVKKGTEIIGNIITNTFKPINENSTLNSNVSLNETEKFKATPEGLFLAYSSLVIMALIPIVLGSFKSVRHQHNQKESGEEIETMSTKEACLFPVIASFTLFGIFIVFQIFSKEHINLLLAFYFFLLGVFALTRMLGTLMNKVWPSFLIRNEHYDIEFSFKRLISSDSHFDILSFKQQFDRESIACFLVALGIGVWYFMKKHWIANNIFGLAFAVNGIEFLQLNKILNGCILLGGLFFYDVFWVFGTNVMVSVAKSFDAPIKLIFPQDLIEHGFSAEKYALLGLGDIVIPGIFIALLLRFDVSLNRNSRVYFYSSFVAYIAALFTTIFVMHVFKHAQPALLYIVPMCLVTPLFIALVKGDLSLMFSYRDHDEKQQNASLNASTSSEKSATDAKQTKEEKKTK